jgi:hypothetical protein
VRVRSTRRTAESLEELVLHVRQELKDQSDLEEFGALAIFHELTMRGLLSLTSMRIIGGIPAQCTGVTLSSGLVAAWPMPAVTAQTALDTLLDHWCTSGLPAFAQFENDTHFHGPISIPMI